jgi:hypothetical protein
MAPIAPMRMVSQIGIADEDGQPDRDTLLTGQDQAGQGTDNQADNQCADDSGNGHGLRFL